MKRELIENIQSRGAMYDPSKAVRDKPVVPLTEAERDYLCTLAHRATEPGMVLVPEQRLLDLTEGLLEHPDDWDYPCFCDECKEYGL